MSNRRPYADRREAGEVLAAAVRSVGIAPGGVVLGLPRGGVPVAAPVAAALDAALDVVVVRKLRTPAHDELAMGAIASAGGAVTVVRNEHVLRDNAVAAAAFDAALAAETTQLRTVEAGYRSGRAAPVLAGRCVVLVDDGLATGATMRAALAAVRAAQAATVVVAVPIGAPTECGLVGRLADQLVCPWTPQPFYAVGQGYLDFGATTDAEVHELLARRA